MPWGAVATGLASAVGGKVISGALGGAGGGGGTSGGSAPPVYIPSNQAGADTNFNQNLQQYQNSVYGTQNLVNPYEQQLLGSQFNNPYANVAQANANQAGIDYEQNAANATQQVGAAYGYASQQMGNAQDMSHLYNSGLSNVQNSSNNLYNMAGASNSNYQNLMNYQSGQLPAIQNSQNNLYGAGNQVLNTSMDPQGALYNQTLQQVTDQSRAGEYARGIQSSPYGAAVEASNNQNFNLNWQNQQLARETQGLSAAQGAYGSAQGMGNSYTGTQAALQAGQNEQYTGLTNSAQNQYTNYLNSMNQSNALNTQNIGASQQNALNLGNAGAQSAYNAGQAPYGTYQQIYGNQNQAIGNYNNSQQPYLSGLNQIQSNDLGYMNYGQSAQNQGYQQNMGNNQASQQAISQFSGPVSSALQNTNWGNLLGTSGYNAPMGMQSVSAGNLPTNFGTGDVFSGFSSY